MTGPVPSPPASGAAFPRRYNMRVGLLFAVLKFIIGYLFADCLDHMCIFCLFCLLEMCPFRKDRTTLHIRHQMKNIYFPIVLKLTHRCTAV